MKKAFLALMAVVLSMSVLTSCTKEDTVQFDEPYTDVYNEDGTIEKKIYFNDDNSVNFEMRYEYDDHGNIVTESKYLADGTLDFKSTYEYKVMADEYKEIKRVVYKNEKDVEFYQSDYEYVEYDKNGKTAYRLASFIRYGADKKEIDKTVYEYDESGALSKIKVLDPEGTMIAENTF